MVKNVTLNGGDDGAISINLIYGGTAPYTYNIGTGIENPTTEPFTGLRLVAMSEPSPIVMGGLSLR